ncbi:UDP-glucose 6-dehydrogenase YwqF [Aquicella siphonis]|uniref:UDP-glucose 6-dehydrogenase n=1 Tax=Aquicella siphonis TaxID=254247 RepID=A0A5E4PJ23_9COXI|nr:UDP-glucose/GDP-mannose dehydrogenase family protein [Aquicella siphonis]VVC76458.1 UDP-glucose 6-dehydrogenase YwqF [Aquicella siphonis]
MNITVIGAGYVGLVTGACFAELGNHVTCVDVNESKIANLKKGILPIYEPGLEPMVISNMNEGRLQFVSSMSEIAADSHVIFIAVGTPSDKDGAADIQYVLEAARNIGAHISQYCVVVDKSTVPVGMADQVDNVIREELQKRGLSLRFDVVSNPEFLREGAAIEDFMRPDRVIIGLESNNAKSIMLDLYLPILRSPERIYFMNVKDAEMTKYAANAMLATRISFMNEMSVLCERMGVDIENVRIGIGSDTRIGSAFLNPGCGYGGSCFPKDVRALVKMAERNGVAPYILHAVEKRNFEQKRVLPDKIVNVFGEDLTGVTLGVWGLSFKPGTDDMREASSLVLIEEAIRRGACVQAYDPAAVGVAGRILPSEWMDSGKLKLTGHQYDALKDADALVLVTEWKPFCYPDMTAMKNLMRQFIIFDGRNQYDPKHIRAAGFEYYGMGRGEVNYKRAALSLREAVGAE